VVYVPVLMAVFLLPIQIWKYTIKFLAYLIIKTIVNILRVFVTDAIRSTSSLCHVTEFTVTLYISIAVFALLGLLRRLGYGFGLDSFKSAGYLVVLLSVVDFFVFVKFFSIN
jgi:hypothetical protein